MSHSAPDPKPDAPPARPKDAPDQVRAARLALGVAVIAALSALGGSAVGGYFTNEGMERQFKDQRRAQLADVRRAQYVEFLRVADRAYRAEAEDALLLEPELFNALAAVLIVASPSVREAADTVPEAALGTGNFEEARDEFVRRAQTEADEAIP